MCRMPELTKGTMVTTNLRLVNLLGEGAMGSVWITEHLGLQTNKKKRPAGSIGGY